MGRRERRQGRKGPGLFTYLLAFSTAVVSGLGLGIWGAGALVSSGASAPIVQLPSLQPASSSPKGLLPQLEAPMNVLFMATDATDEEERGGHEVVGLRGNSDTMMLLRLDPAHHQVRLLSIPRDTRVPIPGHRTFKINAANPWGGPALAMQTVSAFLGVPVDRYVVINTRAVIALVNALGGVTMYVPKDLNYDDRTGHLHIHLTRGYHHLDGQAAHDFLRFRHDDLGDIGRVQRQQLFLQAFMGQYMTPMNLLRTPTLFQVAKDNLATDLSPGEILRIASWGKDLSRGDVTLAMVPGQEAIIHGGWYWVASTESTHEVVNGFLMASSASSKAPAECRVAVRDGVGAPTALRALSRTITHAGYGNVEFDGPSSLPVQDETRIIAQKADVQGAQALASAIGVGKVEVDATGELGSDFTVVMGRDWLAHRTATQPGSP